MNDVGRVLLTADTIGGVWTYAVELMRALPEVEFALATMGGAISAEQREQIASFPNVAVFSSNYRLEWMDDPWDDVDRAGEWLLEIEREFAPDIVHLNGYCHASLPWSSPVLAVAHSCVISWWRAVRADPLPSRFDEYWHRVSEGLRAADRVVAPTAAMLASLRENYHAEFDGRVIANGRDHASFRPAVKQQTVFAAGRLWDAAKNLAALDRIAPRISWPIRIAGDGSAPGGNEARFDNVQSLGLLTSAEVAVHLATAAIYVAPAFYEPFGLGIVEAALSGCALVLGDIPSLRELWDDAAVFVTPDDDGALVSSLQALIGNPAKREELGLLARRRALEFTIERMAAAYQETYADCLTTLTAEVTT